MRALHDRRAKDLLELLLRALLPHVPLETEAEVSAETQRVDVLVQVDETHAATTSAVPGLLGRMLRQTCLLEPFSRAPNVKAVSDCVRKHLTFRHVHHGHPSFHASSLWMLTSGDPKSARSAWQMTRARGWPTGVYRAAPATGLWLVVLPQLPRIRETLTLRLLGRDRVLHDAIEDAARLRERDVMRRPLESVLQRLELELRIHDTTDEESATMNLLEERYQAHVKKIREEGIEKGIEEGIEKGLRITVFDLCEAFGVELDETRRARIETLDHPSLDALRAHLKKHRAWPSEGLLNLVER